MVFPLIVAASASTGAQQSSRRKSTVRNIPLLAIAVSSILPLVACAGTGNAPLNTGERISQRGSQINESGDMWSAGQEDVARGERIIAASNESIDRAQSQVADANEALEKAEDSLQEARQDKEDAERLVADGYEQMERAEEDYEALRAEPSAGNPPSGAIQNN